MSAESASVAGEEPATSNDSPPDAGGAAQASNTGLRARLRDRVDAGRRITRNSVRAGQQADSAREAVTLAPGNQARASNLAAGAMTLLITLMIVLLAALVGGKFANAVPSDSTFSDAISTTTDNAGTAFVIFGVSLLAIPTVAVLAYMITRLGGFVGFTGQMGGRMGR